MAVKIIGVDKCIRKFALMKTVDIMPEIISGTRLIQSTAKELVPVDTGTLKGSIMTITDSEKRLGIVYTVTEYAPYVEFGTRKQRAQPFLTPAFDIHIGSIKRNILESVKRQLKEKAQ